MVEEEGREEGIGVGEVKEVLAATLSARVLDYLQARQGGAHSPSVSP